MHHLSSHKVFCCVFWKSFPPNPQGFLEVLPTKPPGLLRKRSSFPHRHPKNKEMSEVRTWRGAPGAHFAHLLPLVCCVETFAKPRRSTPDAVQSVMVKQSTPENF